MEDAKLIDLGNGMGNEEPSAPEVRYRAKPKGNWVQIEPMPPKEMPKSAGGILMPGMGARRRQEQADENEHTKFKMTHARVLSVGPDVTRVKVGDVIRFVGHPQCQMTGESIQECIINGEFVDFLPETLIYAVLEPIAPDLKVLQ